jgi:hypothetical protein
MVTQGNTYVNALETTSKRSFWAISAKEGLIVKEAVVSNTFAELFFQPMVSKYRQRMDKQKLVVQ